MSVNSKAAIAATMIMAFQGQSFPLVDRRSKNNEPKNKLNLSDEQIELLKTMTPKQKKKFIRGLK
jgi:hypothetical protein